MWNSTLFSFFSKFFITDMSQFSLSSANSHWGYSTTSAYPPYLGSTVPAACTTPTAAQFNNPALGFSCSPTETSSQDFAGSRDCVPSNKNKNTFYSKDFPNFLINYLFLTVLPDSTATDLDQHLSSLVGTPPSTQMTHQTLISSGGVGTNANHNTLTPNNTSNNIVVTRYGQNQGNNDYNLHSSQNGPRSLSDSSQAESPVQDDLLTSNTPNLGGNVNQNFTGIGINQNQNSYGNGNNSGGGCNGSIYPVLPASLLYTQLYTAANQSHSFHHSHSLQTHSSQNSLMHGELQSVMDHIVTGTGGTHGGRQQHHNLMAGNTDLGLIGNCGSAARAADENANRQLNINGQRGQQAPLPPPGSESAVWRPY